MKFDIDKLSKEELLDLNRRVVERLKYLSARETLEVSRKFKVGDTVEFQSDESTVQGIVMRINRKTLSIKTKEGRWNVPPQFVKKVVEGKKNRKLRIVE
jgi:hypothetical protein